MPRITDKLIMIGSRFIHMFTHVYTFVVFSYIAPVLWNALLGNLTLRPFFLKLVLNDMNIYFIYLLVLVRIILF